MSKNKDIGLKVATKREALWLDIKERAEEDLKAIRKQQEINLANTQRNIDVTEGLIEQANRIIKEEQNG